MQIVAFCFTAPLYPEDESSSFFRNVDNSSPDYRVPQVRGYRLTVTTKLQASPVCRFMYQSGSNVSNVSQASSRRVSTQQEES
jgi:hypothetical protein